MRRNAKQPSRAARIKPLGSAGLWLLSSCSGLAIGEPDLQVQERPNAPIVVAAAPSPGPALESLAPDSASPAVTSTPEAVVVAPLSSLIFAEQLHRARRAAQDAVLGRESPKGRYALPYAPGSAPRLLDCAHRELTQAASDEGVVAEHALVLPSRPRATPPALGHFVAVEPESALASFHRVLGRLAKGEDEDGKVRVLVYGASHTQADIYTGYLRAYLQNRFGDGGQGFVLLGRVNHWYRTLDTRANHHALTVFDAARVSEFAPAPLGLFGAAFVGRGGSYGEITTAKTSQNTEFELHYLAQPGGGSFDLQVDGTTLARVATNAETAGPAHYSFRTVPGEHRIRARLRGSDPVRLFGVVAETATTGVVIDTLGISGARMSGSLRWDEHTWAGALRQRKPDLVLFAYGTNEASDSGFSLPRYESDLRTALSRLRRVMPEVSCVLVSPFDLSDKNRPRLLGIIDAQRRISQEFGCGFWNGYAFMGGERSIRRWASAKPPLASPDSVHLTRLGYVYAGIAIGDALMRAYDDAEREKPATAQAPAGSSDSSLASSPTANP
jgi:hypothetical protein